VAIERPKASNSGVYRAISTCLFYVVRASTMGQLAEIPRYRAIIYMYRANIKNIPVLLYIHNTGIEVLPVLVGPKG